MQSPQACRAASSDSSYNPIGDGTIERRCNPMARQPARGSTPATATKRTASSRADGCLSEGRHRSSRIGHTIGNRHDDDACKLDRPHRLPTKSATI
ncbi:hypothetical protein LC55x_3042 [Lysobacter capsici]|nr:hypothetical protein LC55x_3042 [Lysobacter capsici]